MLWMMAKYANDFRRRRSLGFAFRQSCRSRSVAIPGLVTLVRTPIRARRVLDATQFLARFGALMPPREFGEKVVSVLEDPEYAEGVVFGLKGDTGITVLEGAAA